jgi:hypothetical protein
VEAYNRRDPDAVVIGCHPEFEYHPGRDWVEAGLVEPCYRGLEGYRKYLATVDEVDSKKWLPYLAANAAKPRAARPAARPIRDPR